MTGKTTDCRHGAVRSECEVCEAMAKWDAARAEVDRLREIGQSWIQKQDDLSADLSTLRRKYQDRRRELALVRDEVKRLRECMREAGLQCFMRDRTPDEVAGHMRSVMDSYAKAADEAEARAKATDDQERAWRDAAAGCLATAHSRITYGLTLADMLEANRMAAQALIRVGGRSWAMELLIRHGHREEDARAIVDAATEED